MSTKETAKNKPGETSLNIESSKTTRMVAVPQASVGETLRFVLECGVSTRLIFALGCFAGVANGVVYPTLAYLFSNSFSDISAASNDGLAQVRKLAYTFLVVGSYALVVSAIQGWAFETCAYQGCMNFRLQWFKALLRQDSAYFDVHDAAGIANGVGPASSKFRRGVGRKFGEGIQFLCTGVFGLAFAFYSSWRVSLVVLCAIPLVSASAMAVMTFNQGKGTRSAKAYSHAGSVAYTAVSSIRTVLSLNAVPSFIRQYEEATSEAMRMATAMLIKIGAANGSMLGSFLILYATLSLYGTALFYRDIEDTGCDPSAGVEGAVSCESTGPAVFGAMLGVAFAAQGLSQFGNFSEAFTQARVAVYEALQTINRLPGAPEEKIYKTSDDALSSTARSAKSNKSSEESEKVLKAILPKYLIDSTATRGLTPKSIVGRISFKGVHFKYPTRPGDPILNGMNVEIAAGQTVAFVGKSGEGKSTVVSLLERFYDPLSGVIELDGTDLKDYNVSHLRRMIGMVGQEPTLFATSIRGNIKYGNPDATDEQIEEAARMANAHDFISSFTDGYDTQVGDKGSQLSGGQKQRIAIARVLVGNPQILLLDEATSALDAESELVVQDALDNIVQKKKITTIIIAHRLSTIRNADTINVIHGGKVVESGTHDELLALKENYYRLVQKQEESGNNTDSESPSRSGSAVDLTDLATKDDVAVSKIEADEIPHIEFREVNFAYPTRPKKLIFKNFNLKIRRGETLAFCGPSGFGKSTTVGLIERFYDPSEGTVFYDGNDLKSLNVSWYRDQLGYVGQEPTLFNDTIAGNIAYGFPGATQLEIEEAAKQSNAHDFIMTFPEGYNTPVGERGTQLSGGQKQRVAIARALVKKPKLLILDEATSALDNESEAIVQAAIDKLMESRSQTVIVIAHRLSTIRNADTIAYIGNGKVMEYGSHDELIAKPHGLYKRLFDSSKMKSTLKALNASKADDDVLKEDEDDIDWEKEIELEQVKAFDAARARKLASPDSFFIMIGGIGAVMAGGVFPSWGVIFSETIDLLFRRVEVCPNANGDIIDGFDSCPEYWQSVADEIQDGSFKVAFYWLGLLVACLLGNILVFWGFGHANERLSKRVRDSAFNAIIRQEVAFFDKRSVGRITSELQDDAARIQAFCGEPIRQLIVALSSVITGVVISFIFMWQFALLALACVPFMGFATSIEMKTMLGEDIGNVNAADELNSPGGIVVETLLNIRTVSALCLESARYENYEKALLNAEPNHKFDALMGGSTAGLSMFIQQWVNALQLWFGGYLLFTYPERYEFKDFLIANFAILFSLFGLGAAFQDAADSGEVKKSIGRIFYLLDRESKIDPLSTSGKKLE